MPTVAEISKQLEQKSGEWKEVYDRSLKCAPGEGAPLVTELNQRNDEMTELGKQLDAAKSLEAMAADNEKRLAEAAAPNRTIPFGTGAAANGNGGYVNQPGVADGVPAAMKTLGEAFTENDNYKSFIAEKGGRVRIQMEAPDAGLNHQVKATFSNTGGALTGYDRQAGIVAIEQQRLFVIDMLMQGTTTEATIRYLQENTFSNAATAVAEGAQKPEASFDLVEKDAQVRKIAVTAKVTDEQLADYKFIREYMNSRMNYMVNARAEALVLNGDGNAPNILGIMQTSGIQTQAKSTDPIMDAIYKSMTKIRVNGFFEPDGVIIHPLDWQDVRLLRTADGQYIWGSPADAGPERMWGKNLSITTAISENTALVGAFKLGAQWFLRQGVTMEATNSNEDDFEKNLVSIRVEMRGALAVYRPLAFCTTTGI